MTWCEGHQSAAPAVSLVLVAHRSSHVLAGAVAAFRREAAAIGISHEVVVVEQSEDAGEVERVAACAPGQLLVRPNRGYAAGINAGIAAARGDRLLLANPDVELGQGSLAALLAALAAGWDVVGPQFELAAALFPPAEAQSPGAELARRLARPGAPWRRQLRRQLRRWLRVWEAVDPQPVPTLSGALLACTARSAARFGTWDEEYFLYFEETDWLHRAQAGGARLAVVPAARAVHRWGHAARPETMGHRFAASQQRYYRRHFPRLARLLLWLPVAPPPPPRDWAAAPEEGGWRWLVSPSPAAGFAALLPVGPRAETTGDFCRAAGRDRATLVAWQPDGNGIAGPFHWPAAAGQAV